MESKITGDNPGTPEAETGWYLFDAVNGLTRYFVEIDASNFALGGALHRLVLTSGTTYGASPMQLDLGISVNYLDADFGFTENPVQITKALYQTAQHVPEGSSVTFRITVTNTGAQALTPVPLNDFYSPACLNFVSATVPPTFVDETIGLLRWNDLGELAAGQSTIVDVTFTAAKTDDLAWQEGGWPDYAPKGIPDFDQKQAGWDSPVGSGSGWHRSGPVAAANLLWWFDSKFESSLTPPPAVSGSYALVKSYATTPLWDDHDPRNVVPLVDDLRALMGTTATGTTVTGLTNGVTQFISNAVLATDYTVTSKKQPASTEVADNVKAARGVLLLLGIWQESETGGAPKRIGGHWVSASGFDTVANKLAITDPQLNNAESGGAGRVFPGPHSQDHPTTAGAVEPLHNDAQYLSQDIYDVATTAIASGTWGPANYVGAVPEGGCAEAASFAGKNVPDEYAGDMAACDPAGGDLITTVEYAVTIAPKTETMQCAPTVNIASVTDVKIKDNPAPLPPEQSESWVSEGIDFGDLPDPAFKTLLANDGARHLITSSLKLGGEVDSDTDGQPGSNVDGDDLHGSGPDDEDGVELPGDDSGVWKEGTPAQGRGGSFLITIAGGEGVPEVFLQFFEAIGLEKVDLYTSRAELAPTATAWAPGTYHVYFAIPDGAMTGDPVIFPTRVRLSKAGGLGVSGPAPDGEVEDHVFKFRPTAVTLQRLEAVSKTPTELTYGLLMLTLAAGSLVLWRRQTGRKRSQDG